MLQLVSFLLLLNVQWASSAIFVAQTEANTYKCPANSVDGFFQNPFQPCSRVFFACANGDSFKEFCNPGLAYDQRSNECLSPHLVPECSEASRTTPVGPTNQPATDTAEFRCPKAGNFPDPDKNCSSQFFICSDEGVTGQSFRCPKRTYYDPELNQCQFFLDIPLCSGQARTTRLTTTPGTTLPPIFDCSDKQNGNYPLPNLACPTFFIQCANQRTFPTNCPGILRYNPYANQCLGPNLVPGCPGAPDVADTTSTLQSVTQPLALIDCEDLGTGYHKNPSQHCSEIFYACVGTTAILQRCPYGTKFDQTSISCLFPQVIPDCNGKSAATTERRRTTPATRGQTVTTQTATTEFLFPCNESFGTFPDPQSRCSHVFYVCGPDSWVGHKFTCPSGTFYDSELNLCDIAEMVPLCTGRPRTTRPPTVAGPTAKLEFDCLFKHDGNYVADGAGCPSRFFQCSNGQTFPVNCPGALKYDAAKDQCLPGVVVPGCPGGPPGDPATSTNP